MVIFELIKPGLRLTDKYGDKKISAETLLREIERSFYEANFSFICLQRCESEQEEYFSGETEAESFLRWKEKAEINSKARDYVIKKYNLDPFDFDSIAFYQDREVKRMLWDSGKLPNSFNNTMIMIYSKSIIYAFDAIDKSLKALNENLPEQEFLTNIKDKIHQTFPNLTSVRDSAHHREARALGIGKYKKKMDVSPIETDFVYANTGVILLDSLLGDQFSTIIENGRVGSVEISNESFIKMRDIIQEIFNSFDWEGQRQFLPN